MVPLRALSLLRPAADLIVLPATEACREMWEFARETLGLSDAQVRERREEKREEKKRREKKRKALGRGAGGVQAISINIEYLSI